MARVRELGEEIEAAVASAFGERNVPEPSLCAALVAATYRTVHLEAIRKVLAGDPAGHVDTERMDRLRSAFDAVERMTRLWLALEAKR